MKEEISLIFQMTSEYVVVEFVDEGSVSVVPATWIEHKADVSNDVQNH